MTDKEKIRAEVERLKRKLLDHILIESDKQYAIRAAHQFNNLLQFIDSLPEEPASEDLEEEIDTFFSDWLIDSDEHKYYVQIARHFAEWGRNHFEDKSEMASEDIENEIERFAYSLPHSAYGFWPKDIDPRSVEARTKYGVHHDWSYEQVMNIARHFAEWQREQLMKELWHKGTDNPGNKHPYPVINPDTQEMAFAYYDLGWQFDRDYNPGCNMLWLDIEKIIPNLTEGGGK